MNKSEITTFPRLNEANEEKVRREFKSVGVDAFSKNVAGMPKIEEVRVLAEKVGFFRNLTAGRRRLGIHHVHCEL